jgi:hypothetical protein
MYVRTIQEIEAGLQLAKQRFGGLRLRRWRRHGWSVAAAFVLRRGGGRDRVLACLVGGWMGWMVE